MPTYEESGDQRAKVIAAAQATASWVRSRRAAWATEPLPLQQAKRSPTPAPSLPAPAADPGVPLAARLASASAALKAPLEKAATVTSETTEQVVGATAGLARSVADAPIWSRLLRAPGRLASRLRDPIVRWTPRLLVALLIVGIGAAGVRYAPSLYKTLSDRLPSSAPTQTPTPPVTEHRTTGVLKVESTPAGARILVDGVDRGNTPMELDVAAGKHVVLLESNVGTVQRMVTVTAGLTAEVNESIFAGFLTIYSPFEVAITEGGKAYRPDDRGEIMLPAGKHDLRLSNRALGFEEVRSVDLTPGQRLTISVTPPQSTISVTATESAEVWLDNIKLGDTPLTDSPVTLGTHNLVVRRAAGGERRFTITVTVKPFSMFVDFSRGT